MKLAILAQINILSCTGDYYYIESLHICVTNCQSYGLVNSKEKENTCEDLITASYITIPVYLNNSYDYNPNNEDYISKIIDRDNFKEIAGNLSRASTDVQTKWIFNRTETLLINKLYRYFDPNDFPENDYPFDENEANKLKINVKNEYFKYGYKYVFNLEIFSQNGFFSTKNTHRYILMMNDYPLVGTINILPSKGYINNQFLITINKCKDDVSEKNLLTYKFSYFKKKENVLSGHNETSEEEIIIQEWSKYSEVLYQFPELPFEEEDYKYYIRGYCRDEFDVYDSEIQEVEVNEMPIDLSKNRVNIPLEESIETIDLDEDLTTEQLLKRTRMLATSTVDFEKEEVILNRTNISTYNKKGLLQENLILIDPDIKIDAPFCNIRGSSYIIYQYLICDCNGYDGNMCRIDHPSYESTVNIYKKLFNKIKRMQTGKYNKDIIQSLNILMKSASSFMNIENMDFMLEAIEYINLYKNRFIEQMIEGNNYEIYFDIYNSLIEYGLSIVNKLKYKNFIKNNAKNVENNYDEKKFRNATLAEGEGEYVRNYFHKVKIGLQSLLEFYASNKKEIRFINNNINVYVSLIDHEFNPETYFSLEKKLYEPYMNFHNCLERTIIKSQGNPSFRVFLSSIIWKVSPYMSDESLYWNTSSPIITFKFLDYDTGEQLYLSDCVEKENQIQLYFPVNNYNLVNTINSKKMLLSPDQQYDLKDSIFCDPVYINKSGAVLNTSLEERRQKYFIGFNFSCKYYKVSSEDQNDIRLIPETLDFNNYTKDNYIQCLSNKLMQESYGEFVVDSYLIPYEFHLNSRYFYLKHFKLLSWKDNYKNNQAFYYFVLLSVLYAGLSIVYIYFEKYHYINMQRLVELRKEVTKLNLPYRDEYLFNNDLYLKDEVAGKMKEKRKPNMEEMNLDINNVDIGIMADEIGKHKKGFIRKENNALDFNPEFFGIKKKENFIVSTKFFNDEENNNHKIINSEEISPERFEKAKKFYHEVGFKGLSEKENSKKEMQLSKDKKRIIINKKVDLEKISEKDEGPFEIDLNEQDFFNKEIEDQKEDIKTNLTKNMKNKNKMNKYKEFIATSETMENLDSESQLKSSKRETSKKKFFGSNPPKKENDALSNSLNLPKKEEKKIIKSNSAFFENDRFNFDVQEKKENIFQNEYKNTSTYKPKFKHPKIITENLAFYSKDNDFEQEKDSDNTNPPYFGKGKKRKIIKDNNDIDIDNAEMRVGFYFKNKQIELADNEERLPELTEDLTFEKKMEEFHSYSISFKKFLIKNILSRHILLTTFDRMSIIYDRYMRAGNFFAELSMFAFFLTLFFINDEKQTVFITKERNQMGKLLLYCFISDILGCISVHLPAYCFWVNDKKLRILYNTVEKDRGMRILKQLEDIVKHGRIFWNILGVIIQILYVIIGFYFSFGFCATFSYQSSTFCLGLIIIVLFDFIIAEPVWEIVIGLLYYVRDWGRLIVFFGTIFNSLRNIKHLI